MEIIYKIKNKLWYKFVVHAHGKFFYYWFYKSWWNFIIHGAYEGEKEKQFLTARPNIGAGIGHQISNWNAGLWFSKKFKLKYAHTKFIDKKWDELLGFGSNFLFAEDLIREHKYKQVSLPIFDEKNEGELRIINNIIKSYGQKIVFKLEQDQFYADQIGVIEELKDFFYNAQSRAFQKLKYDKKIFNIAIHVRRGDISNGEISFKRNMGMRWLNIEYFQKILSQVLMNIENKSRVKIYIFSQSQNLDLRTDLVEIEYCDNMSEYDSFLHLVYADLLITSKSSFSYKPALLSRGIKISPRVFWHKYPNDKSWILADENGTLNTREMSKLVAQCTNLENKK